jgi:hypothetical protein
MPANSIARVALHTFAATTVLAAMPKATLSAVLEVITPPCFLKDATLRCDVTRVHATGAPRAALVAFLLPNNINAMRELWARVRTHLACVDLERVMAKYGKSASKTVASAMRRKKKGTLRSGSGRTVTSRKQAIAIGLSEAREKGAKVPASKPGRKTSRTRTRARAKKK